MTQSPITSFSQLLGKLDHGPGNQIKAHITSDWMQGRTTYGGLTAALCCEAAKAVAGDLPIRNMQIAFIGPVGGDVTVTPTILRQGKNSVFVGADMIGEAGLAARAIFVFGARRDSQLAFARVEMPEVGGPGDVEPFFPSRNVGPAFTQHFDIQLATGARPISGTTDNAFGLWMRHRDHAVAPSPTALLALGDCPPPAAFSMVSTPGRISSMTWAVDFVKEDLATDDGWYFAHHVADATRNGYSSQAMTLWNSDGAPIMIGRQTIAIFA